MLCRISYLTAAVLVLVVDAHAAAWSKDKFLAAFGGSGADGLGKKGYPVWLKGLLTDGTGYCNVAEDYGCIVGVGEGTCYINVYSGNYSVPLSSTDSGYRVHFSGSARFGLELRNKDRSTAQNLKSDQNITVTTSSPSSHWNLCWKKDGDYPFQPWARLPRPLSDLGSESRGLRATGVEDYCYFVNGLCFLWASPCSGGCAQLGALTGPLANPAFATFCPAGLRYASAAEWVAAEPTLLLNKAAFHSKCAAEPLDPTYSHCDQVNALVRVPNGGYDEQVLVCGDASTFATATPSPTPATGTAPGDPGSVSAKGDPHLQNVHGQRFDLMKPGKHVLINIPRGQVAENSLLRVQAYARRLGGCADLYFQELNVTGSWAEFQETGGYHYTVSDPAPKNSEWLAFERIELKVVHAKTKRGLKYLNFFVKHLSRTGFEVGGLLGEDDHTQVAIPSAECTRRVALMEVALGTHGAPIESSRAEASSE